jgi:hypothetical protein
MLTWSCDRPNDKSIWDETIGLIGPFPSRLVWGSAVLIFFYWSPLFDCAHAERKHPLTDDVFHWSVSKTNASHHWVNHWAVRLNQRLLRSPPYSLGIALPNVPETNLSSLWRTRWMASFSGRGASKDAWCRHIQHLSLS